MLSAFNTFRIQKSSSVFISLGFLLALTACNVPTDVASPVTTQVSSGISYSGFTGITAATTISATRVKIQWKLSTDPTVKAYNIYNTTNYFNPVLMRTILVSSDKTASSSFTLTGLSTGSAYSFRVRAVNGDQVEDTNTVDLQAIPYGGIVSATVTSGTTATVIVADITNADSAGIYCNTDGSSTYSLYQSYRVTGNMSTTFINGISTNSLSMTEGLSAGVTYTCKVNVTIGGVTDNNVITQTFTPVGKADHIMLTSVPAAGTSRTTLTPIVVTIYDAAGNVVVAGPDSTASIKLSTAGTDTFYNASGSTLGTLLSANAVRGVATFSGYSMRYPAGIKTLQAQKVDTTASDAVYGTSVMNTSNLNPSSFLLSAGPADATKSTISASTGPLSVDVNTNGSTGYTIQILLQDIDTNPVIGSTTAFAASLGGQVETSNFTINGPGTTDTTGTANSANLYSIGSFISSVSGTHVLSITSPSFTVAPSTNAIFTPGIPAKLGLVNFPSSAGSGANQISDFKVQLLDQFGNGITSNTYDSLSVALTIASCTNSTLPTNCNSPSFIQNGSNLATVSANITNGLATFSGLGIVLSGNYQLNASITLSPSKTIQTRFSSNPITIGTGSPVQLVLAQASPAPSPSSVVSGTCGTSNAFTLQFQDASGQVTAPGSSVTIHLSSTGSAKFYLDSTCSNASTTTILPSKFTSTTKTVTIYVKDLASENVTLSAYTDNITIASPYYGSSSRPTTLAVGVSPALVSLTPYDDAVSTAITSALSGHCIPYKLQMLGSDSSAAIGSVVSSSTKFTLSNSNSNNVPSNAKFYSNNTCSTQITDLTSFSIASTSGATASGTAVAGNNLTFYVKDNSVETLVLGVAPTSTGTGIANMTANNFYVTPSQFKIFAVANPSPTPANTVPVTTNTYPSPTTAYPTFTVQLLDASGTPAPIQQAGTSVPVKLTITKNPSGTSSTAAFYSGDLNSGYTALTSSLTNVTSANVSTNAAVTVAFNDTAAESLTVTAQDPSNKITDSTPLTINVYPKQFKVIPTSFTASSYTLTDAIYSSGKFANVTTPTSANTGVCTGFVVKPYDSTSGGTGAATTALFPTTINLAATPTGNAAMSVAYTLYSDSSCTTPLTTSVASPQGTLPICGGSCSSTDSATFYFKSNYPGQLTFTASDANNNIPSNTASWTVTAAKAFLGSGTYVPVPNSSGGTSSDVFWSTTYNPPKITPTTDVAQDVRGLRVSADQTALYVADPTTNKVLKYDYANNKYVGWIGSLQVQSDYPVLGSGVGSSMASNCKNLTSGSYLASTSTLFFPNYLNTPGWCLGGTSTYNPYLLSTGGLANPVAVVDDGNYVYVANQYSATITRHKVSDGSFAGWIGNLTSSVGYTGLGNTNVGYLNAQSINYSIPALSSASALDGSTIYDVSTAVLGYYTPGWSIGGGMHINSGNSYYSNAYYYLAGSSAGAYANSSSNGQGFYLNGSTAAQTTVVSSQFFGGGVNQNSGNRIMGAITTMAFGTDSVTPATSPSPVPYLYVGTSAGMVHRVNATTGAYMGWIGTITSATVPSNLANPSDQSSCQTSMNISPVANAVNTTTSGWCVNGSGQGDTSSSQVAGSVIGIAVDQAHNLLFVARANNTPYAIMGNGPTNYSSTISSYNLITGAFNYKFNIQDKVGAGFSIYSMGQISVDSTLNVLYVANGDRLMEFSINTTTSPGTLKLLGWTGKTANISSVGDALSPPASMGANPSTLSGTCSQVGINQNTNQWCYATSTTATVAQPSLEPAAFVKFSAIADDGNGNIITGQTNLPMIKKFSKTSGSLLGILTNGTSSTPSSKNVSSAPGNWSDSQAPIGGAGLGDQDLNAPAGSWIDSTNNIIYIVEAGNNRIKKVNLFTGQTLGWIGGTSGYTTNLPSTLPVSSSTAACGSYSSGYGFTYPAASSNSYQWCLGAYPNVSSLIPINGGVTYLPYSYPKYNYAQGNNYYLINYIMNEASMSLPSTLPSSSNASYYTEAYMMKPVGITGDSTYLYVTDSSMYRIVRFKISDGSYQGWIGGVLNTTGMSAASTCANGLTVSGVNMTATACWVFGGTPVPHTSWYNPSSQNWGYQAIGGFMSSPGGITLATVSSTAYLYAVDGYRINRYNATTGAFSAWIGQYYNSYSTTGASSANGWSSVSYSNSGAYPTTLGWTQGGYTSNGASGCSNNACSSDTRGQLSLTNRSGIATDGTNLYVSNSGLKRIDAFDLATGVYQKSTHLHLSYIYNNPSYLANNSNANWTSAMNGWIVNPIASTTNGSITTGCNTATSGVTANCNLLTATQQQYTLNHQTLFWGSGFNNQGPTPYGLIINNGYIYVSTAYAASMFTSSAPGSVFALLKIDATGRNSIPAGALIGWKGGIDPAGKVANAAVGTVCVNSSGIGDSGFTSDWCLSGRPISGNTLGTSNPNSTSSNYYTSIGQYPSMGFQLPYLISTDGNFIYMGDENQHRLIRIPASADANAQQ